MIHDVKEDHILQVPDVEQSMSSKYRRQEVNKNGNAGHAWTLTLIIQRQSKQRVAMPVFSPSKGDSAIPVCVFSSE